MQRPTQPVSPFKGKFCNSPFEYCYIDQTGDAYVCCPAGVPTIIGNLLESDWPEVWNSPTARQIRETILDETFYHCNAEHCPYLELPDRRLFDRDNIWSEYYRDIVARKETFIDRPPHEVNIAYDATCNLSCPYCRNAVFGAKGSAMEKARRLHEKIWTQVLPGVQVLTVAGNGDAFASKLYREALENFDPARYPGMQIQMVTNGLLFTPQAWERIKAAHPSIWWVNVSINAASAETFAINQRGGNFNTLLENLEFVREVRRQGPLARLTFSFIVQSNNYWEIPEFVALGRKYGADQVNFVHLQPGPLTPAEYARLAIHRPSHPEHHKLVEVLADPRLRDESVFAANLTQFLPHRIGGSCHSAPPAKEAPAHYGEDISFDSFCDSLRLDGEVRQLARERLDKLADDFVRIMTTPRRDGGDSPAAVLARAVEEGKENDAAYKEFQEYAAQHPFTENGDTYLNVLLRAESQCRTDLSLHLTRDQRIMLKQLNLDSLLKIRTGYDALGIALTRSKLSRRAAKAPAALLQATSWEKICSELRLNPEQRRRGRAVLRRLKDAIVVVLSQQADEGKSSPILVLAERLAMKDPDWQQKFAHFLNSNAPAGAEATYAESLADLQSVSMVQLLEFLDAWQQEQLKCLANGLGDLDIGYDPMADALKRQMRSLRIAVG